MCKYVFILAAAALLCLSSCNSSTQSDTAAKADSTKAAIDSVAHEAPDLAKEAYGHSELLSQDSLPTDSMKIVYGKFVDTLYGHRKGNSLLVEGDIVIDYPHGVTKGVATTFHLWPKDKHGIVRIPYSIDPGYPFPGRIKDALAMWSHKLDNEVLFVPVTFQEEYVVFVLSDSTQSNIGKKGGVQKIKLADWALEGNIVHEVGHLLGLYHEQSRRDRNQYVRVLCPDDVDYRHAYKGNPYTKDLGAYDYYSIMHYPPTDCMDVIDKHLPKGIPGQRKSISAGDSSSVKAIYGLK